MQILTNVSSPFQKKFIILKVELRSWKKNLASVFRKATWASCLLCMLLTHSWVIVFWVIRNGCGCLSSITRSEGMMKDVLGMKWSSLEEFDGIQCSLCPGETISFGDVDLDFYVNYSVTLNRGQFSR